MQMYHYVGIKKLALRHKYNDVDEVGVPSKYYHIWSGEDFAGLD